MKTVLRSLLSETLLWRSVRGLKRFLAAPRLDAPLSAEQCRGTIAWLNPPPACEAKAAVAVQLRLENQSGVTWSSAGSFPVTVRCQWITRSGEPFDAVPTVVRLPQPLFPGEPQELTATVPAPDVVGDFTLELCFAQADQAFASVQTAVPVVGRRTTDIDYHAVFRTANLTDNHWWVVGAYHSQEQYEKSSRERLEMLVKQGLTPDSRVLDIGCGTGQMAGVLAPYLSDRGGYAGTDIGAEAIAFCDRTFRRKNFAFKQGGMTSVPFTEDGTFDCAIFFSVFTHTFTDETALLMAEAKRLLKPTGVIIADVITSPLVERGAGHRGEMVVNRDHFLRLAAMLGYTADVIGRWPWNRHAERFMFKLRQG
ncbi:class I SAM-dependent methyltransferase [Limnoglobus roseus]|uniref:Class I SAM-dependent methyltransferase n=1 Tax=Limnoglobus roseus TaxID=2598579 RepID=A0A5C1AGE8_9BACT|nr:class I SAM-dependent methyltransferase [Limnoglobus roseus]QEL16038.1 class I SAM-dependent methyltransferase [Limnoglobus roseus]